MTQHQLTKPQLNKLLKLKKQLSKLDHRLSARWIQVLKVELTVWGEQEILKIFRYCNKKSQIKHYKKLVVDRDNKRQELKDYWKSIVRPD